MPNLVASFRDMHPGVTLLDADDPTGVDRYLQGRGWLASGEVVQRVERAGEGNMNLTLAVHTDRRCVVVKQARPWVEKYPTIAAPWERSSVEAAFYQRVADLPGVGSRMPRLLAEDAESHVLLMEHLTGAADLSGMYSGQRMSPDAVAALAEYLVALHEGTRGAADPALANRAMRELNHGHIFVIPLSRDHGLDLDAFEPGLAAAASLLIDDATFVRAVHEMGHAYLDDGPCLLHGDFFPGSWMLQAGEPRVIDPEFGFFGPPAYDLGVAAAHFVLAEQPVLARGLLDAYAARGGSADQAMVARFAGCEVMRRLIGVAQLPLTPNRGRRATWLDAARLTILNANLEPLCHA